MTVTGRKPLSKYRGEFRSLSTKLDKEQDFTGTGSVGIPLLKELIETRETTLIPLLDKMKKDFIKVKIVSSLGNNCFHIEFTSGEASYRTIVRGREMVS